MSGGRSNKRASRWHVYGSLKVEHRVAGDAAVLDGNIVEPLSRRGVTK